MASTPVEQGFRKVGLVTCIALVLANMIGTGVFTSLGFQISSLPSPFLILLVWVLGGLVALCGAMCYAELAAALPRSGGEYNFLSQIYHPAVGFMAGFISVAVGFAAPIALAAMAFGTYLNGAWSGFSIFGASLAVVIALSLVHSMTVRASGNFQIGITTMKVSLIVVFILIGLWVECGVPHEFVPKGKDITNILSAPFAVSLMFVLYSYSGWNAAAYIIGEVRNPQRTVPWALLVATAVVTLLYVSLNAVFLAAAPMEDYVDKIEVGEIAAKHLLGEDGGRIMSGLISLGLISAVSAMTWAGPRVAQSIGRDFSSLRFLSRTSAGGVPRVAMIFQTSIVLFMLITSSFENVLLYAQFAILACSFLTVLGVLVLRWRQPNLPRPFRCFAYPLPPLIYLALNFFALVYSAIAHPTQAVAGFGTLLLGIALYFLFRNRKISS